MRRGDVGEAYVAALFARLNRADADETFRVDSFDLDADGERRFYVEFEKHDGKWKPLHDKPALVLRHGEDDVLLVPTDTLHRTATNKLFETRAYAYEPGQAAPVRRRVGLTAAEVLSGNNEPLNYTPGKDSAERIAQLKAENQGDDRSDYDLCLPITRADGPTGALLHELSEGDHRLTVEVKVDDWAHRSGNYYSETHRKRHDSPHYEPTGLSISNAAWYAVVPSNVVLLKRTLALKELTARFEATKGGDNGISLGAKVPLEDLVPAKPVDAQASWKARHSDEFATAMARLQEPVWHDEVPMTEAQRAAHEAELDFLFG